MSRLGAAILLSALAMVSAQEPPVYKGVMQLPVEIYTADGTRLDAGRHDIEVKRDEDTYTLSFLRDGKTKAAVKGMVHTSDPFDLPATIPLVGTHFLRSSADPLASGQERQFSKTGLPQYAEESRVWRAALRVFREADSRDVYFIFQEVQAQPNRVDFKLSMGPTP